MSVVDNTHLMSVVILLLCFVDLAGCITVNSEKSPVEELQGNDAQLTWTYTKEKGESLDAGSVGLVKVVSGNPETHSVATFSKTKGFILYRQYSSRGWTISSTSSKYTLTAMGVKPEDDGSYYLELVYQGSVVKSAKSKIELKVLVLPHFPAGSVTKGPLTYDEGEDVTLKCEPDGSPKPIDIDWRKNGVSLIKKNSDDPNLVLKSVTRVDTATYTCVANNTAGPAKTIPSIKVDVKYKPVNTKFNVTSVLVDGVRGSLECSAEADPPPTYTIVGGPISVSKGTVPLNPVRLSVHNNKVITCTPNNRLGDGPQVSLTLDVQVKPNVSSLPKKLDAIHHRIFSVKCLATGKPSPDILWLKDSSQLRNQPPTSVVKKDSKDGKFTSQSILKLAPVNRNRDNGVYSCLARNDYGEDQKNAELKILFLPEVTTIFRSRVVRKGSLLEQNCEADGEPKVTYYVWRWQNGSVIQNKTDGKLVFLRIQPSDGGRLSCAGVSPLGEGVKKYFDVFVRVPPQIIIPPYPTVSLNVSERLLLFCNASGVPEPVIHWSHNSKILRVTGEYLDIFPVKSSDRGTYTCTASNGILPNDTATSVVAVYFPPEIVTNTAANTMKGAESGSEVQLVCIVEAKPPANLEWLHFSSRLPVNESDDDVISIDNTGHTTKLRIKARIGAKYLCHAYNNRGNTSQVYEIRPKGPPEAPHLKDVKTYISTEQDQLSTVRADVEWVPGYDGGESVWYRIWYGPRADKLQLTPRIKAECNCFTFKEGLKANTDYVFFVQAHNSKGPSNNSNPRNIRTKAFYGEASVVRFDEKTVKLNFLISDEENVTKVIVRYRQVQESIWRTKDMTYEMKTNKQYVIRDLDPDKLYEFQVLWRVGDNEQITRAGKVGGWSGPPRDGGRSGSSLNREEIIAIIAGVGGFLLIVILVLFLCLIRKRQKPRRDETVVVMRRQPGSMTAEAVTRRSLIGSVEDDPFESAHYGSQEKKQAKARDSYYLPDSEDLNTFSADGTGRRSANPAKHTDAYQPYRFGGQKQLPSDEELSSEPGYARPDDLKEENSRGTIDGPRGQAPPNTNDIYSRVNKRNNNNRTGTNGRGAPPPYRPRSTAETPRNLPPYPDDQLDLDDPSGVPYDDPLPPPMEVLPTSHSVPDNMWNNHYPDDPRDDDSTLERHKSPSRTSLPGKPYINVHGKLVRPGSSGRLSSSEYIDDDEQRSPEPEVPTGRSRRMDSDNDERNLVSYLV